MASVQTVLDKLEEIAPTRHAFSWDKIGLQVGDRSKPVIRATVALDRSLAAIQQAKSQGAQLLLTHHPLIFDPIKSVTSDTYEGRAIQALIQSDIAHIAAHTNWDAAKGGINDTLCQLLGIANVTSFGSGAGAENLLLVTYVPVQVLDEVIDACSSAGAGMIGNYRRCGFYSLGTGTFEPTDGANPYEGKVGERALVEEYRLEMTCPSHLAAKVLKALRDAHPYEEPAFDLIPVVKGIGQPMGRVGTLAEGTNLGSFALFVDRVLDTRSLTWGDPSRGIKKVAIVGGAAEGEWRAARSMGADVLITGEVRQHVALEAAESGMAMIAAGHYATEHPGSAELCSRMASLIPDVDWSVFTPVPGEAGRPF